MYLSVILFSQLLQNLHVGLFLVLDEKQVCCFCFVFFSTQMKDFTCSIFQSASLTSFQLLLYVITGKSCFLFWRASQWMKAMLVGNGSLIFHQLLTTRMNFLHQFEGHFTNFDGGQRKKYHWKSWNASLWNLVPPMYVP